MQKEAMQWNDQVYFRIPHNPSEVWMKKKQLWNEKENISINFYVIKLPFNVYVDKSNVKDKKSTLQGTYV